MYKASEIITEVKRLKKEYSECIYDNPGKTCSYSKGSCKKGPKTKGCLVGQAIRNVYPDLFKVIKKERDTEGIEMVLDVYKVKCTENQKDLLICFQNNQDNGDMWGEC